MYVIIAEISVGYILVQTYLDVFEGLKSKLLTNQSINMKLICDPLYNCFFFFFFFFFGLNAIKVAQNV